ncbi:MAG: hypothetical protein HGA45_36360 [Chloroflexales bacterium]|nr:hypothetical protein [Chloroflexales bacterium]
MIDHTIALEITLEQVITTQKKDPFFITHMANTLREVLVFFYLPYPYSACCMSALLASVALANGAVGCIAAL